MATCFEKVLYTEVAACFYMALRFEKALCLVLLRYLVQLMLCFGTYDTAPLV